VKLFAGRDKEIKIAEPEREKAVKLGIRNKFIASLFWILPSLVEDLLLVVVILASVWSHILGLASVAELAFAITVYEMLSGMIWRMAWGLPDVLDTYSTAREAYRKIIRPIEIKDMPGAADFKVGPGRIKISRVSFDYGKKKGDVLQNLSLDIKPGERVGLVGMSGSGKTTLANLIMRLYDPKAGKIEIDGQDIRHVTQDSLHRAIAFIPQDSILFHRSLAENIGYGKDNAKRSEIIRAAKHAGAHEFIMAAPKKYDTLVGDRGIKLSGGQRQRIAIARAIIKDAPILIMDEATSALDSETEQIIQKSFDDLSHGKTTIVIAHRLSTLRHMNRIVVMSKGKIVESGTHAELLKRKGQYAKLWNLQSAGFLQE
jgi:ATP-binding cassette subfamily B protein